MLVANVAFDIHISMLVGMRISWGTLSIVYVYELSVSVLVMTCSSVFSALASWPKQKPAVVV